jgi:hypothetical protein
MWKMKYNCCPDDKKFRTDGVENFLIEDYGCNSSLDIYCIEKYAFVGKFYISS